MVGRGEPTDKAWAVIEPLLPPMSTGCGRWRDHRQVINGILWKLRTGAPWRDLPERYGPWKTCHERLRRWTADETWDKILAKAQVRDDGQPVECTVSMGLLGGAGAPALGWHPEKEAATWPPGRGLAGVAVTGGEEFLLDAEPATTTSPPTLISSKIIAAPAEGDGTSVGAAPAHIIGAP